MDVGGMSLTLQSLFLFSHYSTISQILYHDKTTWGDLVPNDREKNWFSFMINNYSLE